MFCIPESYNTDISHQLFNYIVNFVNLQIQNSKGDFVIKKLGLKISGKQK